MPKKFGYRWSCLTKDIIIGCFLAMTLLFFEELQSTHGIIAIIIVIVFRLVIGAFPLSSIVLDSSSITIRRPWLCTPDRIIQVCDIVDYRPFNANSKISFLNGSHIITKTGAKHIILADGISGFDELNGLLVSKYSTGDEGAEIKQ